jgi:hypothetical protein
MVAPFVGGNLLGIATKKQTPPGGTDNRRRRRPVCIASLLVLALSKRLLYIEPTILSRVLQYASQRPAVVGDS